MTSRPRLWAGSRSVPPFVMMICPPVGAWRRPLQCERSVTRNITAAKRNELMMLRMLPTPVAQRERDGTENVRRTSSRRGLPAHKRSDDRWPRLCFPAAPDMAVSHCMKFIERGKHIASLQRRELDSGVVRTATTNTSCGMNRSFGPQDEMSRRLARGVCDAFELRVCVGRCPS